MKKVAKIYSKDGIYFGDVFYNAPFKCFSVVQRGCSSCFNSKDIEEIEEFISSGKVYGLDEIKYLKSFKRA